MNKKELPTLKEARDERGVSQTLLAKYSTVSQPRISLIERAESEASFTEKVRIALALDVIYDEIAWPTLPKEPTKIPEEFKAAGNKDIVTY